MRSFIAAVCVALSLPVLAQEDWHFTVGEELTHGISLCLDLEEAKAIVNADRDSGSAAGEKRWAASGRCRNMMVSGGPKVGKVVHEVKTKREGSAITLRVVEILSPDGSEAIAYMITARKVLPAGRGV